MDLGSEGLDGVCRGGVGRAAPKGFKLAWLRDCPDSVKLLNPEGRIGFLSDRAQADMEIEDPASVVGRPWWDFWPDDQAAALRRQLARAATGEIVRFRADRPTTKGAPKTWDVTISPIMDGEGRVESLLAVSREVAGRKGG